MTDDDLDADREDKEEATGEDHELGDSLWEELGLPGPPFQDEKLAPKVDLELLNKLVRHELPKAKADAVYDLIYSFRSWNFAHAEILMAQYSRLHGGDAGKDEGDD